MLSQQSLNEFRSAWLPNITDVGLNRLIELLGSGSPLLIHGSFTRAVPQGCLATQIAWNHPTTTHLTQEAGITWLHHVAGLNPATSHVIREWDRSSCNDFEIRAELLDLLREERTSRQTSGGQSQETSGVRCQASGVKSHKPNVKNQDRHLVTAI
ncbi:MAG TPA: hypothetical protein VE988_22995 [Gemmataceae bacterium]|nr:hypothetical protein [Gemmataceae bacterium]